MRHPFPGPGIAIRVLGEVTREQVAIARKADHIFIEEIRAAGLYDQISQAFAALLPVKAVGVMGDKRVHQQVVSLRAVQTTDFMTANIFRFDWEFLERVSTRIVNEVQSMKLKLPRPSMRNDDVQLPLEPEYGTSGKSFSHFVFFCRYQGNHLPHTRSLYPNH